jgi:putative cardiolipin synthase
MRDAKEGIGSSSSSALHAKTIAVDRARIFVGSFNLDQRSLRLNTEMGLVIGSPALAGQLASFFDSRVAMLAYQVRLAPDGNNLEWIEQTASGEKLYGTEPGTSWFLRTKVDILSVMPIDWLL